ncbi:MAG TPA: ADP-ribosylglycohydrolase family protein [Bacillales bacterium]
MKEHSTFRKDVNHSCIPRNYIEKMYAGWLGKVIGVRHGAKFENWTYEEIERAFGEINHYVYDYKNFAADDDTNGPMFFLRALEDYTYTSEITAEQMGLTWLNYAPDGHGFYWWGGYGKSTEHTAYLNLKNGIMAPRSGSIEQNGAVVAEQIGGQIFIDVWGLIAPGNPQLASEYAEKIASVSHDGNGKYGGMFIAACIAEAFVEQDIKKIMKAGLSVIPDDCEYTRVTEAIMAFYEQNPGNWKACRDFAYDNFGYDRYPGNCHIIPNAAVIILSLLYSEGDFAKAINICNMCGWDTDCNTANVGTIMGVRGGLNSIEYSWRKPINDFLCCSSVIGTLNMLDIPWCASYIANLGYKIAGEAIPGVWEGILTGEGPRFHFEYPGSTHAFRLDDGSDVSYIKGTIENTTEAAMSGSRSLKVFFDNVKGGKGYRAYYQTYYRPSHFNDSRYDPSFSPQVYPGQTLQGCLQVPVSTNTRVKARLYVKDCNENRRYYGEKVEMIPGEWIRLNYEIPKMKGVCLEEAGIELIPVEGNANLVAYIDHFTFSGKPDYEVDFSNERPEEWHILHIEVSQFTYLRGLWTLEDGQLSGSYSGEPAECYTGDLKWKDYAFEAVVIPKLGDCHNIQFRVQGGVRSYAVGLAANNKLTLYKNTNGYKELASIDYSWEYENKYVIRVKAVDDHFIVSVNGEQVLEYTDHENPYLTGQIGFSNFNGSHTHYKAFSLKGM